MRDAVVTAKSAGDDAGRADDDDDNNDDDWVATDEDDASKDDDVEKRDGTVMPDTAVDPSETVELLLNEAQYRWSGVVGSGPGAAWSFGIGTTSAAIL